MKVFIKEDSFYLKSNVLYDAYQQIYEPWSWTKNIFYVKHSQGTTVVDINDLIFIDELRDKKLNKILI